MGAAHGAGGSLILRPTGGCIPLTVPWARRSGCVLSVGLYLPPSWGWKQWGDPRQPPSERYFVKGTLEECCDPTARSRSPPGALLGDNCDKGEVALLPVGGSVQPRSPPVHPQHRGGCGEILGGVGDILELERPRALSIPWPCAGWWLRGGEGRSCGVTALIEAGAKCSGCCPVRGRTSLSRALRAPRGPARPIPQ